MACRMSFHSPDKAHVVSALLHHGIDDDHRLRFAHLWLSSHEFVKEWKDVDWKNTKYYEVRWFGSL